MLSNLELKIVENHYSTHAVVRSVNGYSGTTLLHRAIAHSSSHVSMLQAVAKDETCSDLLSRNAKFQPRLLTHRLQKSERIEELQQLWEVHNEQFNSIHFSALMKQLEKLHAAAQAGQFICSNNGSQGGGGQLPQHQVGSRARSSSRRDRQRPYSAVAAAQQHTTATRQGPQGSPPSRLCVLSPPHQDQQQEPPVSAGEQPSAEPGAAQQLALNIARTALAPGRCDMLDGRALVMITHSLARVGVADPQLMRSIVHATGPHLLRQLDAQQLTNLIWSVAVCTLQGRRARFGGSTSVAHSSSKSSFSSRVKQYRNSSANILNNPAQSPGPSTSGSMFQLPHSWLLAAADALQGQLVSCASAGLAMALWGFAQLGFRPDECWWSGVWRNTQGKLVEYSAQDLASLIYACGKLKAKVPDDWLSSYLSASCAVLPSLSPQQLTMCLWGLATAGCQPDKAWIMLWFLESRTSLQRATTQIVAICGCDLIVAAQDLSLWLYSLAVLRITPSPLWCTSFVEASFNKLTAAHTPPQELATAMWAISCLSWSPPLLFWKGLLDAAAAAFSRFNPQDLSNCISAATVVDVSSVEKRWLTAFLQASESKSSAFLPVHLAHTAKSLAAILKAHDWACLCIQASWQTAFIQAAAAHLAHGRFSERNLQWVVDGVKQFNFNPATEEAREFLKVAEVALERFRTKRMPKAPQLKVIDDDC